MAEKTWPMIDHCFGDPFWAEITSARSWLRAWSAAESREIAAARSSTGIVGHGPLSNASRAAATALSMSAGDASGTWPMTCSVCGETTSMMSSLSGFTNSPPMNSVS